MVLVEYHNYDIGASVMSCTNVSEIDARMIITLAYRLLYLLQFIAIIVTMGWLQSIVTIGFLGSSFLLLFSVISAKKELFAPWDFSYLSEE